MQSSFLNESDGVVELKVSVKSWKKVTKLKKSVLVLNNVSLVNKKSKNTLGF